MQARIKAEERIHQRRDVEVHASPRTRILRRLLLPTTGSCLLSILSLPKDSTDRAKLRNDDNPSSASDKKVGENNVNTDGTRKKNNNKKEVSMTMATACGVRP
jgi:hypothetical protein